MLGSGSVPHSQLITKSRPTSCLLELRGRLTGPPPVLCQAQKPAQAARSRTRRDTLPAKRCNPAVGAACTTAHLVGICSRMSEVCGLCHGGPRLVHQGLHHSDGL